MTPDPNIKVKIEASAAESLWLRTPEIREVKKSVLSFRLQLSFEWVTLDLSLTNFFVLVVILPTLRGVNWRQNS